MELSDQVTNLELSKKLKELGVPQDSIFYHYDNRIVGGAYEVMLSEWNMVSAWIASELLELLPISLCQNDIYMTLIIKRINNQCFRILYESFDGYPLKINELDEYIETPRIQDGLSLMLIHLLKTGRIKAEDLKL